jgi:polyisoprenoid-binding protein YceI
MKNGFMLMGVLLVSFLSPNLQKLTPVDAGSKVHFVIRNFGINTGGDFKGLKGQVLFDKNNLTGSSFDISIAVSTIDTDNSKRDNHLRKEAYFDVAHYPTIRIKGKPLLVQESNYILKGTLTIKDITKPIEIPFTVKQQTTGYLFEGAFEMNRLDYKVGAKSAIMADQVKITLQVLAK